MSTYKIGHVYRIICLPDPSLNYVGSTFMTLRNRWQKHKLCYKAFKASKTTSYSIFKYFDKYGIDQFKLILIKDYEVCDHKHLQAKEQLWISKLDCVNEYNSFQIRSMTNKQYRLKNREKILEKITCLCGSIINNVPRHKRTKKHLAWELSQSS